MDGETDRWTERRTVGLAEGQMDGEMDRWTERWTDGLADGQIDGETDITNLIVAFRNSANAPKKLKGNVHSRKVKKTQRGSRCIAPLSP
jgi:hypothetical protein